MNTTSKINSIHVRIRQRRRCGAVALEAALVAPLLLVVLFGAVDIGQYVNVAQSVSNASREGARYAGRVSTQKVSDVRQTILNYLQQIYPQLTSAQLSAAVTTTIRNEATGATVNTDLSTVPSGDPISVSVSLNYAAVRWLSSLDYWNLSDKQTKTVVRRE